jgi:acetyl esterase/lipase
MACLAVLLLLWCALLYVPFRWRPVGLYLFMEKVFALGYLPFIAAAGVVLAAIGVARASWWTAVPAGIAALGALVVIARIRRVRIDLPRPPAAETQTVGEARLRQDVPFATVPGSDRVLVCDLWQPPAGVPPSGVAVVYLHGSAYYVLDKDVGTRPLFQRLAAQGHVVVDVAYRLFPETDVPGMVGDALRAVAWVRGQAAALEIDPDRIVLAGGSAGGHLALLAAYGAGTPALTPPELAAADLRVCAVASLYGQVGLDTMYQHTGQERVCRPGDRQPDWAAAPSAALVRLFGANAARLRLQFMMYGGRCDWLVGGTPQQVPEAYARLSALSYVHADCPPTLLIHGTHDQMAPVTAVRQLQHRLKQAGATVTAVILPHTDHMFDLVGARWSPAARVAIRVLERFLAAVAGRAPVSSPS